MAGKGETGARMSNKQVALLATPIWWVMKPMYSQKFWTEVHINGSKDILEDMRTFENLLELEL